MKRWMALGDTSPEVEFDTQRARAFQPILADGNIASFEDLRSVKPESQTASPQQQPPSQTKEQDCNLNRHIDTDCDEASAAIISALSSEAERLRTALSDQERELKLAFEERVRDLETQQSLLMHEQLEEIRVAIVDVLSAKTAEVLKPVLSSAFLEATVAQYRRLLSEFLASEQVQSIKIKGRKDVVNAVKGLACDNPAVAFYPTPDREISFEVGNIVITSKLTSWADSLVGVREIG